MPLRRDPTNGFANNHTEVEAVIQDLKMLLLTSPGERIMDPNFGVGMRKFLFEQNNSSTHSTIRAKIIRQTMEYMPFLEIQDVQFSSENNDSSIKSNGLLVTIKFIIAPLGIATSTQITV